jgi:hypothetical protein
MAINGLWSSNFPFSFFWQGQVADWVEISAIPETCLRVVHFHNVNFI